MVLTTRRLQLCRSLVSLSHCSLATSTTTTKTKNVAVILSGCGYDDGTNAVEASAALVALSRNGSPLQHSSLTGELLHLFTG
eukprot:m.740 g.740  ORF g.740 m.740 type:complete len:82 (+) comp654_c0_seq1:101-346(+)